MKLARVAVSLVGAVGILSACVTAGPGDKQGEIAPRLKQGSKLTYWENPGSFGPVPAALATRATQICSSLDHEEATDSGKTKMSYKPTGYHARAVGLDGKLFDGGGFYCVPR